jgi:HEAT repeat protein
MPVVRRRRLRKYVRIWPERYAPKHLRADDILRIMRTPVDLSWSKGFTDLSDDESDVIFFDWRRHWWPRKRKISRGATTDGLLAALRHAATPSERAILIEILGWRDTPRIVPELARYVSDRSYRVRVEAADSIAKVANAVRKRFGHHGFSHMSSDMVGPVLLKRLVAERTHQHRNVLLPAALGAVGYRPAIPALITALEDSNSNLRSFTAWALSILQANEAVEPLRRALAVESDRHTSRMMQRALEEIARRGEEYGK